MKLNLKYNSSLSIIIFLITFYLIATFQEYYVHKYFMHKIIDLPYLRETGEEHIKHHIATNKDFSVKNNDHSNICFSFMTICPIFFINILLLYILFHKIISLNVIILIVSVVLVTHMVVWNTMHSYVHYFEVNQICKNTFYGLPKEYINEDNIYVKWSLENHRAHHYYKNEEKGNYNVVFPGADFILGTYNTMPK